MAAVPYTQDNWDRCRCFDCPVHNSSQCITQKMQSMGMAGRPKMVPPADMAEGMYCSQAVGKSKCNDLNGDLSCICPTCQVWQMYGLKERWFCIGGPEL